MTSNCVNRNLFLKLWVIVVPKSIITLIANFSSIKVLLTCFFGSSTSSYLCFLWFELHFVAISGKCLWSSPSSIYFSFNHSIQSLSIIVSIPFLSYVFLLLSTSFICVFERSFRIFYFFFHLIIFSQYIIYWNKFLATNIWID